MVLVEDVLREGDTLLVTELDRLGRNKRDTMEQIRKLQSRDVRLMVLELYASISESEIQKKEKRQREGIAMKKLRGEWDDYGRPPAIKEEKFSEAYQRVTAGEISQAELKRELGLSHTTFYRYRKKYFEKNAEIFQSQKK